ncbi:MAG: NnrS family protein [Massilia sp.]
MALLSINDPARARETTYTGPALLGLGFRPFYLLAAAFAAVSVPAWLASYYGFVTAPAIGLAWHMHEMVFGFVVAVVVGFLYTAARNWTGLWTPRGAHLGALAALWIAGRAAMLWAPAPLAALVDLAFLPLAAWPLYRVMRRADNRRNLFLVGLLGLLALANAAFHASAAGLLGMSAVRPIHAAIMIVVVIEAAIGGRVIPHFTANSVPGTAPVINPRLDRLALALAALAALAWIGAAPALVGVPLSLAAAAAQAWRLAGWKPMCTLRQPLLWVLHLSYAWIPAGFVLLALAQAGLAPLSAAVHVLAVGALGGLIVGMITRTALGHTGRPLKAGGSETAMYLMIQLGVLARLGAALATGSLREPLLLTAGALWSATFLLYAAVYAPRLFAARPDGREG